MGNAARFWPDARGWIGFGTFFLTVLIIVLIWQVPSLREDEFFKNIAVLIIGTGWVNGAVSWAYSATKTGGELADRAMDAANQGNTGSTVNASDTASVEVNLPAQVASTEPDRDS